LFQDDPAVELIFDEAADLPARLIGMSGKSRSIPRNLISNAPTSIANSRHAKVTSALSSKMLIVDR
jgi:hypothetical protein